VTNADSLTPPAATTDANDLDLLVERAAVSARAHGVGVTVERAAPLVGGHSGLTIGADLVRADGSVRRIVIKAAPPGRAGVGRHDVMRQARLYRTLASFDGVRVPEVILAEESDPPFFAMSRLEGEAIEPILAEDDPLDHTVVRPRMLGAASMLAALHGPDASVLDLEAPRSVGDELDQWSRTLGAVDPDLVVGGVELRDRLERSMPADGKLSVIHGDYRLGNILCLGEELQGIIDWEIWGVADPRLDLGWFLIHADASNYPGIGVEVADMPSPDEVLAAYEDASGSAVEAWQWFDAFGRFKMAAIMAHNLRRHREGRHVDPFQERLPPTIAHLIETGRDRL